MDSFGFKLKVFFVVVGAIILLALVVPLTNMLSSDRYNEDKAAIGQAGWEHVADTPQGRPIYAKRLPERRVTLFAADQGAYRFDISVVPDGAPPAPAGK